jgi:Cd2+/Zn2+-exporting ATPase
VDKTGTITEGKPRVQEVEPIEGNYAEDVIRIAAALDSHSDHPIAQAVVAHARARDISFPDAANYTSRH